MIQDMVVLNKWRGFKHPFLFLQGKSLTDLRLKTGNFITLEEERITLNHLQRRCLYQMKDPVLNVSWYL